MASRDRDGWRLTGGAPATFVDRVRGDGSVVRLGSRRHRKHLGPARGSTWWAPRARGWWIAVLFAVGSLLFALGAVSGFADAVGARRDSITYFIGSLFFTGVNTATSAGLAVFFALGVVGGIGWGCSRPRFSA